MHKKGFQFRKNSKLTLFLFYTSLFPQTVAYWNCHYPQFYLWYPTLSDCKSSIIISSSDNWILLILLLQSLSMYSTFIKLKRSPNFDFKRLRLEFKYALVYVQTIKKVIIIILSSLFYLIWYSYFWNIW